MAKKLWVLALEPIEMRYTKQWRKWFQGLLIGSRIEHEFIDGNETHNDKIAVGQVLDVYRTNRWKLQQLDKLLHKIQHGYVQNGDKIFTFDMWHTGLEVIQYIKSMTKLKVDLYGIWHAGSYDHSDFTYKHGFEPWAFKLEQVWGQIAKKMFVGSVYHQKMIADARGIKTIVTGLPIDIADIREQGDYYKRSQHKKNQVVFTSRLDPEKRPDLFEKLKKMVKTKCKFIMTHKEKMPKWEYYQTLAESKIVVSTAEHENFGIGIIEGMALGCVPIVPNGLSYVDYVPEMYRYRTLKEGAKFIDTALGFKNLYIVEPAEHIKKYQDSFSNMLKEMGYK